MPVMLMWVLALLSLTVLIEPVLQDDELHPARVALASHEVDQYKTFLYVASLFMQTHPSAGTFHWQEMRAHTPLPIALLATPYPPSWVVVVQDGGAWSTCTPMSGESIGMLLQWATPAGLTVSHVESNRYVVLGQDLNVYKACP